MGDAFLAFFFVLFLAFLTAFGLVAFLLAFFAALGMVVSYGPSKLGSMRLNLVTCLCLEDIEYEWVKARCQKQSGPNNFIATHLDILLHT